jgi:hypothetical protein
VFHEYLVLPAGGGTALTLAAVRFLLRLEQHLVLQLVALVVGCEDVVFVVFLESGNQFLIYYLL